MTHLRSIALAAIFALLLDGELQAETIFEDFSVDPLWTLVGSGSNSNDFGYRPTAFAGGAAGEGGGHITRSTFVRTYANTALGGTLGLNDVFQASGKLDVTGYNSPDMPTLMLGHVDSLTDTTVGLFFNNTDEGTLFVEAGFMFSDLSINRQRITSDLGTNVDRTWGYSYDPLGGVNGLGRLTAFVSGPGTVAVVVDLTVADRLHPVSLNAFGIDTIAAPPASGNQNRPDWFTDIFIDDVTYSNAIVPEPSSIVLGICGLVGLTGMSLFRILRSSQIDRS